MNATPPPANEPKRRLSAERRNEQIVQVARNLMIDRGFQAVTMRSVATGCGLSIAGVQHIFPDKASLVLAMIGSVAAEYDDLYERLANIDEDESRLDEFLRWIVCDEIARADTAGFYFEMWRLAHREPAARAAMSKLYEGQLARMALLVQRANSRLDERQAAARAAIIMGSTDGFMNTIGYGKTRPRSLREVEDIELVNLLMEFALM